MNLEQSGLQQGLVHEELALCIIYLHKDLEQICACNDTELVEYIELPIYTILYSIL